MNKNPASWLYTTLDGCCERYYNWDFAGCKATHFEATLVSGSVSPVSDPTDALFYPDWGRTDTCINDGRSEYCALSCASIYKVSSSFFYCNRGGTTVHEEAVVVVDERDSVRLLRGLLWLERRI